jgi:hypothetical protein
MFRAGDFCATNQRTRLIGDGVTDGRPAIILAMTEEGKRFRSEAEECRKLAEKARKLSDKEAWLRLAADWLSLAQQADDRQEQGPSLARRLRG